MENKEQPEIKKKKPPKKKITAYEKKLKDLEQTEKHKTIPEKTKAHKFLNKIVDKLASVDQKNHLKFINELHDNITGLFKAAVNVTDRFNKKYEARRKQIDEQVKKHTKKIEEIELKIKELHSQKDYIKFVSKKEGDDEQLLIKVNNELGNHTIIKGKEAQLVIDKPIHGVFIRERDETEQKKAKMLVQGSFE